LILVIGSSPANAQKALSKRENDASSTAGTEIHVKKGGKFSLALENLLPAYNKVTNPDGYICTKITPSNAGSNWSVKWSGEAVAGVTDVDGLNTPNTGQYTFAIKCLSQITKLQQDASVQLEVYSSSNGEI
jgi:hypothetical protein